MAQSRIYINEENHEWFNRLISKLKDNERLKKLNIKVDQNFAFTFMQKSLTFLDFDEESIDYAVEKFLSE